MKLLMESWRQYINEGVDPRIQKQIDNLLATPELGVAIYTEDIRVRVQYVRIWLPGELAVHEKFTDIEQYGHLAASHLPHGAVRIGIPTYTEGKCLGGMVVKHAKAASGWGPLLYEIALEYASKHSSGLTSDRYEVSEYAEKVWEKYALRSGVEKDQLDIHMDDYDRRVYTRGGGTAPKQLTPDIERDDCVQASSIEYGAEHDEVWHETPLSKMYKKSNDEVTQALEKAGRLFIVQ